MKCYIFSCFLRTGNLAVHVHSSDSFVPWSACSVAKSYLTLQPHKLQLVLLLCQWDFPGKNTRVGCLFLLQRILLTQGSKLHLLCLHWQADYHCATHIPMQNKKSKKKKKINKDTLPTTYQFWVLGEQ